MSTKTVGNGAASKAEATEVVPDIRGFEIPRPDKRRATLHIEGVTPLIMHRWSEKALKLLEDSQTGKAKEQRKAKNPEQEARDAAYVVPGREKWEDGKVGKYFAPMSAFKHAFLYGVAQLDDVKKFPKTKATGWVFMDEDPIIGFEAVQMRADVGRVSGGNPHMIYRLQFSGWTADLSITYNANKITLEQVVALFDQGGDGGILEWRPSSPKNKSGDYGRFQVAGVTEKR